jgi:hypothetical protein
MQRRKPGSIVFFTKNHAMMYSPTLNSPIFTNLCFQITIKLLFEHVYKLMTSDERDDGDHRQNHEQIIKKKT